MAGEIDLYADTVGGGLVLGLNSAQSVQLTNFFQGAVLPLRIFPVSPRNTFTAPLFNQVDITGLDLLCSVGPRLSTTALLASNDIWTKQILPDSNGKKFYFSGSLSLNTTQVNAVMAGVETYTTWFELEWAGSGQPFCQVPLTIVAAVRDPSGAITLPTGALSYPDWNAARSAFVSRDQANACEGFFLKSVPGGKLIYISVTDDGEVHGQLVS